MTTRRTIYLPANEDLKAYLEYLEREGATKIRVGRSYRPEEDWRHPVTGLVHHGHVISFLPKEKR